MDPTQLRNTLEQVGHFSSFDSYIVYVTFYCQTLLPNRNAQRHSSTYVTGFAKMCIVHTKILIHFLIQLIATLNSYTHTVSPMARLKWSAFLRGVFGAL